MNNDRRALRVLMISTDPGFYNPRAGTGNVIDRHIEYAKHVESLDIIVYGNSKEMMSAVTDNMTIHTTGVTGFANFSKAEKFASKLIRDKKINLVASQNPHTTGWVAMKLKKKLGIPYVVGFHGDFWNNRRWRTENWKHRIYEYMQKRVVRKANGIRVVSHGIQEALSRSGISEEKISVIHTPINDLVYGDATDKQKLLIEELRYKYQNRTVLLFVGRLVKAKNLKFMIDVFSDVLLKHKNCMLIIIGDGEERDSLELMVREKKLESDVRFLGSKEPSDVAVYCHLASILLLLSTNESFGKVIIEAGLCETPTLASATTGAQHIIDDGKTGFIVPINDFRSTSDVLDIMLEYAEDTKDLGKTAKREYTLKYASGVTVKKIIDFWEGSSQRK